ncbi:hypothetical protein Tco_0665266 [Tanacetum coccineum]
MWDCQMGFRGLVEVRVRFNLLGMALDFDLSFPAFPYRDRSRKAQDFGFSSKSFTQVTDTLNRFATMVENALVAASMNVPSAGKATASPAEGEKNTKDADTNLKDELVDLLS